jgi:pyruvate/2-oxoglutarate/acetoin dehydrogenase E1 component
MGKRRRLSIACTIDRPYRSPRDGVEVLLISMGLMTKRAPGVATVLEVDEVEVSVSHVPTFEPLDEETLLAKLSWSRLVFTRENHTVIGGLFDAVAHTAVREDGCVEQPDRVAGRVLRRRGPDRPQGPLRGLHRQDHQRIMTQLHLRHANVWTERIAHHGRGGNLQNHACTPGLSDERR